MSKIGNSTGKVFCAVLQQYLMAPVLGSKVVMTDPHPNAPGSSAVTLSVVGMDEPVDIDSNLNQVLRALSGTVNAVGRGQMVIIEKLPVQEDEEAKYTITIKKRQE